MGLDADPGRGEHFLEQPTGRVTREAPEVAPAVHVIAADRADPGHSREDDSSRPEDPFYRADGGPDVPDDLEGLCRDHAVEGVLGNPTAVGQVGDDRHVRPPHPPRGARRSGSRDRRRIAGCTSHHRSRGRGHGRRMPVVRGTPRCNAGRPVIRGRTRTHATRVRRDGDSRSGPGRPAAHRVARSVGSRPTPRSPAVASRGQVGARPRGPSSLGVSDPSLVLRGPPVRRPHATHRESLLVRRSKVDDEISVGLRNHRERSRDPRGRVGPHIPPCPRR